MEYSEEAKEVLESPKTSEVKTEVKQEESKDGSEVAATVDEDQRKLFVGGLAQVLDILSFPAQSLRSSLSFYQHILELKLNIQEAKDTDVKEYFGNTITGFLLGIRSVKRHAYCTPSKARLIVMLKAFCPGRYGEIEHINLKHDPVTGRSRGFAFIVFKVLKL